MTNPRILIGKYRQHVTGHDGLPVLRMPKNWTGPTVERLAIPTSGECGPQFTGMPVICTSPLVQGLRWYKHSLNIQEVPVPPNGIDSLSSNYEREYEKWKCAPGHETLCVRFHHSVVEKFFQDEALRFDIETRFAHKDPVLSRLIHDLAAEMQNELPNGVIYAEGVSLMILGWLRQHYASTPQQGKAPSGGLSSAQKQRIVDFIDANIGAPLSLDSMASQIGMSVYHFARLFRITFEITPHQYVLKKRLTLTAHALRKCANKSISDVAFDFGFSSQAHFTAAFRRQFGDTPGIWRAKHA
ncbi:helix-turn-helix domain-containing protein [Propionivibrio dicarboxylicus]|uniref:Helix-turn-helix domain-containing protein n=1 Tax=Propionivibrio dicarboxylicus TaxID=83767 RepID=A0A1G8AKG0_9RHOO|nr:AraC family transcriptional regulator [Propionivibrio dicarboxylicus]SDH21333.1 Helix-turn-helix domain-containing protein [Propionivibrio dicarboxylicus]